MRNVTNRHLVLASLSLTVLLTAMGSSGNLQGQLRFPWMTRSETSASASATARPAARRKPWMTTQRPAAPGGEMSFQDFFRRLFGGDTSPSTAPTQNVTTTNRGEPQTVSAPECGNGRVEEGEQCDDGNVTANDECENCIIVSLLSTRQFS